MITFDVIVDVAANVKQPDGEYFDWQKINMSLCASDCLLSHINRHVLKIMSHIIMPSRVCAVVSFVLWLFVSRHLYLFIIQKCIFLS